MRWRVYPVVRNLHLYLGLFVSPFILVFAVSVIFLVHAWIPGTAGEARQRSATDVVVPEGLELLKGRAQIDAARSLLDQLGVQGEIGFLRQFPAQRRMVIPVSLPGAETTVDLNLAGRTAAISTRTTGVWDGMVFLHKMPGPHNVAVRGNAFFMRAWRVCADATVYLTLFLTLSGVYLWTVLRAERRVGLVLLVTGATSLGGLVYALVA